MHLVVSSSHAPGYHFLLPCTWLLSPPTHLIVCPYMQVRGHQSGPGPLRSPQGPHQQEAVLRLHLHLNPTMKRTSSVDGPSGPHGPHQQEAALRLHLKPTMKTASSVDGTFWGQGPHQEEVVLRINMKLSVGMTCCCDGTPEQSKLFMVVSFIHDCV